MARTARNAAPEQCRFFHVLVQGIEGLSVFDEHRFKVCYMRELKARGEGAALLAFTILENHAHLLFYSPSTEQLTTLMKRVNTAFALYYNKCKFRTGYVFNGRFKSQYILSIEEAIDCAEYIHNNCMRENPQFTPKTYPYSSFKTLQTLRPDIGMMLSVRGIDYEATAVQSPQNLDFIDTAVVAPRNYENFNTVLKALIARYNIGSAAQLLENRETLGRFALELKSRTGVSNVVIAAELNINRETLRKAIVNAQKAIPQAKNEP